MACLKPPFRAEDMDGLYKKVIRGNYAKLPSHYSVDLNNVIRLMLQVKPNQRPTCDKLQSLPLLQKRMNGELLLENSEEVNPQLLNTIIVPQNLHYLTDKLPTSNYDPIKTRLSNKMDYVK